MATIDDRFYLRRAARLARRGIGGTDPNPMVGCVIVNDQNQTVGWGYHRRPGGPHAEVAALQRAGEAARGATAYITLEPCNHHGRTGPCAQALIDARIGRVVYARADPTPEGAGGAQTLRSAGVEVQHIADALEAVEVSDPFVHRITTGLPWVIAKWAQTLDGRIATPTGESQWISSAASRLHAHRERGRVDAILTGIGTVLADDPMLTARHVRTRRTACRVVIDPALEIPEASRLLTSAATGAGPPTILVTTNRADAARAADLSALPHVSIIRFDSEDIPMRGLLQTLASDHNICTLLVDGGGGLLGRLFKSRCVNLVRVYIAAKLFGDEHALASVRGLTVNQLTDGVDLELRRVQRRADDLIVTYRVTPQPGA